MKKNWRLVSLVLIGFGLPFLIFFQFKSAIAYNPPQLLAQEKNTSQIVAPKMSDIPLPSVPLPNSSPAPQNAEAKKPDTLSDRLWNLQDADILSVINEVSQETGKNFIIDPRVSGRVTLISSKPVPQRDVYQVFLSILGMLGYSAVTSESGLTKIIPNLESGESSLKVATKQDPGKGDEVVVRVIPLENVSAMQIITSIRPLLPQWSNVSAYTPGNVLILTGRAGNLKRIVKLIQEVDKSTNNHIEVIHLQHASANQVANVLTNLQNAARITGETPTISIAVDDRGNNIILGGNQASRLKTRLLITQLDAPSVAGAGNTEVVYLRYLQAKTLAPLMSKVAQNMLGKDGGTEVGNGPAINPPPISTNNRTVTGKEGKNKPEIDVNANLTNILAEVSTNALVITAPASIMEALKAVIARLDVRPAQVLIEAVIAQISEADLRNFGVQWGTLTGTSVQVSPSPSGVLPTDFPVPGAGNIGIIPNMQIRAVISILENINGVNILSTPSIVVLDNKKATIEVGQDIPEQTGTYATTGQTGTVTPFNTVDRKRVSLKLDVTPQINLGDAVRLAITLENDSLQNPDNPGINPLINVSKIANAVLVNSSNILVIGGLTSNNLNQNINKVPILGDIPVIGALFTQKSTNIEKKTLVVFIKPIIIRTPEDGTRITHTKYDAIREVQIKEPEQFKKIGQVVDQNILPLWGNKVNLPPPFSD